MRRLSALQRLPFFAGKLLRDVTNPLRYAGNTADAHDARLGRYYLVFDEEELKRGGSFGFSFDAEGIPAVRSNIDIQPPRLHYYPIAIGQYALAIFHTWLRTSLEEDRRRFLRLADWFVEHQDGDGCWYAQTDAPIYRLRAPWPSGMAQGRGLSVLTRAWQLTGEERYIEGARRALPVFTVPIERGGISDTYDGNATYEEYPAQPAPHVLNGMIFALFGLWDMARAQPGDPHAKELFERGVASVEAMLPLYDTGWWSLYDLYHRERPAPLNPCTTHYHDMHIKQLMALHAITGRELFDVMARRWADYQRAWPCRLRAYAGKIAFVAQRRLR